MSRLVCSQGRWQLGGPIGDVGWLVCLVRWFLCVLPDVLVDQVVGSFRLLHLRVGLVGFIGLLVGHDVVCKIMKEILSIWNVGWFRVS